MWGEGESVGSDSRRGSGGVRIYEHGISQSVAVVAARGCSHLPMPESRSSGAVRSERAAAEVGPSDSVAGERWVEGMLEQVGQFRSS